MPPQAKLHALRTQLAELQQEAARKQVHISLYLPVSPYISPYLPISPELQQEAARKQVLVISLISP